MTTPAVNTDLENLAAFVRQHVAGQFPQENGQRVALSRVASALHFNPAEADAEVVRRTGDARTALEVADDGEDNRFWALDRYVEQHSPTGREAIPTSQEAVRIAEEVAADNFAEVVYTRARVQLEQQLDTLLKG